MKKLALLFAAALFLTACHCERKTTGTPCRKASCQAQTQKDARAAKRSARKAAAARRAAQEKAARKAAAKKAAEERASAQENQYKEIGRATRRGNVITVEYDTPIQFAHNSDKIAASSYNNLDNTARLLKKYPQNTVTVKGYTDSLGHAAYNVDLSQRRAKSVAEALIERGVPAEQVSYVGYGAANPVASNDTLQGRRKNRRVELEITVK